MAYPEATADDVAFFAEHGWIVVNDAVLNAVAYYQFRTPKAFAAALQRSGRYLPLMRSILRAKPG